MNTLLKVTDPDLIQKMKSFTVLNIENLEKNWKECVIERFKTKQGRKTDYLVSDILFMIQRATNRKSGTL